MSSAQYDKPNITKASKGNKEIVNALTNEEIEKEWKLKNQKYSCNHLHKKTYFMKSKNGNTYSCNCKTIIQLRFAHMFT